MFTHRGKKTLKVKLSLSMPQRHTAGAEIYSQSFLISALHGGVWSTSHSDHFIPAKKPQYPLNRRSGGLRSLTQQFVNEKWPQMVQPTAYNYTAFSNPNLWIQYSGTLKGNLFLLIALKMQFTAVHRSFFLCMLNPVQSHLQHYREQLL